MHFQNFQKKKNKYQKIKLDIVQLNDKINTIDIDLKNTNERFLEEKQYINNNKALLKSRDISVLTNNLLGGEI